MKGSQFLINSFFIILLTVSQLYSQGQKKMSTEQENTQKPNVIIIYIDDLGIGDLSAYGATEIATPNVDRLAEEGLKFTNAHCSAATCTPSRYSLLTGNYPFRKKGTAILSGNAGMIIPTNKKTLPKVFKEEGYRTAVVGKWHLGLGDGGDINWNTDIKPGPNEVGFDYSFIFPATADRVPTVYLKNHRVVGLEKEDPLTVSYRKKIGTDPTGKENPELLKMDYTKGLGHNGTIINGISRIGWMSGGNRSRWTDEELAHDFFAEAENFVIENKEKPFFLFLSLSDIHVPRMPDTRFKGKSKLGYRGDAILEMDYTVGRVMRMIKNLGLDEDTMIIFSSDNGPILDDGYVDEAITKNGNHKPSGIYRSGKYSIFEGGTRMPMIIKWPGKIKRGATSSAMVNQIDLLASFASFFDQDLKNDEALDSFDVWKAFTGDSAYGRKNMIEHAKTQAFLEGKWKYIKPKKGPKRLGWALDGNGGQETGLSDKPQLYNLEKDPGEQQNLTDDNPNKTKELAEKLRKALDKGYTRGLE